MDNENLYMVKGDTFRFSVEIEGLNEDLTAAYFSCKKNIADNEYVFQKSLEDGITKISENENSKTYEVVVSPNDTQEVDDDNYYYDLQIQDSTDVFTPIKGILKIDYDVTREV